MFGRSWTKEMLLSILRRRFSHKIWLLRDRIEDDLQHHPLPLPTEHGILLPDKVIPFIKNIKRGEDLLNELVGSFSAPRHTYW